MAIAKLGGKTIRYKKGALRKQLGLKKSQKLTRAGLSRASKVSIGKTVKIAGKSRKMTRLLKKRVVFGKNLMKRKKRSY